MSAHRGGAALAVILAVLLGWGGGVLAWDDGWGVVRGDAVRVALDYDGAREWYESHAVGRTLAENGWSTCDPAYDEWDDDPSLGGEDVWRTAWREAVTGWDASADEAAHVAVDPVSATCAPAECHEWQVLPAGLLYRSYLAGEKEPRIAWTRLHDRNRGWIWEVALGGRVGLLRHGTRGAAGAEGWQVDLEGAALPRVDPEEESHVLEATDYRFGLLWTRRRGPTAIKAGYYHISSHLGDEFVINNPGFVRLNYVRDSLIFGVMHDVTEGVQAYGEIGYALSVEGGAEPLELQFGTQYAPTWDTGRRGAPFAAVNVHLREEVNFGGGLNVEGGWAWYGADSGHLLRVGLQYYTGKSIQYSLLDRDEQLFGIGIWFDY